MKRPTRCTSRRLFGAARLHRIVERVAALRAFTNERLAVLGHDPVELPPRPEHVLVGFDGQAGSAHAARWASALAPEIELLTVLPTSASTTSGSRVRALHDLRELLASMSQRTADRLSRALEDVEIRARSVDGRPEHEIRQAARGLDLLSIGYTNKPRGSRRLGSTAKTLIRTAPTTTLVANGRPRRAPVSAALGRDAASRHAAAWATALALWLDVPLRLMTARPPDEMADRFEGDGPRATARRIDWPPAHGLESVEHVRGEVLVIGHRGLDMGLGSTALELARRCEVSVLVAQPG